MEYDARILLQNKTNLQEFNHNQALESVQQFLVDKHIDDLNAYLLNKDENENALLGIMQEHLLNKYFIDNVELENICKAYLESINGWGILNKYKLRQDELKEINIKGKSIEVHWLNGDALIVDEEFNNTQHALEFVRSLISKVNKVLDEQSPRVKAPIEKNVRLSASCFPLVPEDEKVNASIRFVHPQKHTRPFLISNGTITEDGFNLIDALRRGGMSVAFAGSPGTGKTTLNNALLQNIMLPNRVFILEEGTNDYNLEVRNDKGKVINSINRLTTRESRDSNLSIELSELLDLIKTLNPSIVVVGEMIGKEAFLAQEFSRAGMSVLTTIHTEHDKMVYYNMYTMGLRKYNLPKEIMLGFMVEAFPITIYLQTYEDMQNRVSSINYASYDYENNEIKYYELYRFEKENVSKLPNGKFKVVGKGIVNKASEQLKEVLYQKSRISKEEIDQL